jgi:SAM-dependent methyltransferase
MYQFTVFPAEKRKLFVEKYVQSEPHAKVLDLGCGPGIYVPFLKFSEYLGVDIDGAAIDVARGKFGKDPTVSFYVGSADEIRHTDVVQRGAPYDIVFAHGLMHHLTDDSAREMLLSASELLKTDGKFIGVDPCFFGAQHPVSQFVTKMDRGRFVRKASNHLALVSEVFGQIKSYRDTSMLIFPFDLMIVEGVRPKE